MSAPTTQVLLVVAVATWACAPSGEMADTKDSVALSSDTGLMPGLPSMAKEDTATMEQMQSDLRMTEGVSADSMMKILPMHRMMVANMISQFNNHMRFMNMQPDAVWQATVDSLRSDLTRMPELSTGEIEQMMPAHRSRVMRLMDMRRAMMDNLKK